jgi:hypothetical protein
MSHEALGGNCYSRTVDEESSVLFLETYQLERLVVSAGRLHAWYSTVMGQGTDATMPSQKVELHGPTGWT